MLVVAVACFSGLSDKEFVATKLFSLCCVGSGHQSPSIGLRKRLEADVLYHASVPPDRYRHLRPDASQALGTLLPNTCLPAPIGASDHGAEAKIHILGVGATESGPSHTSAVRQQR